MINLSDLSPITLALLFLLVVFMSLLAYVYDLLKHEKNKLAHIRATEEKRWQELEDQAQSDYLEILQSANKKAQEIILQANQIKHDLTLGLQSATEEALSEQKQSLSNSFLILSTKYRQQIEQVNKDNIEMITN